MEIARRAADAAGFVSVSWQMKNWMAPKWCTSLLENDRGWRPRQSK